LRPALDLLPFAFLILVVPFSLAVHFTFCIFHFAVCIYFFAFSPSKRKKISLASIGPRIYNLLRENNLEYWNNGIMGLIIFFLCSLVFFIGNPE